ncbi:zinc finger protein 773-like [Maniola jurtina]|uniref:zinc finger protein 773-like n=1 Tax=Maniola jurtina TaxID=191418 RepID=UPI001E686840|nr:zinc finger protein 773-like [Maniola jurtina]XP_045783220.1 zinc finger protein 773-like [Maniola jurtina]
MNNFSYCSFVSIHYIICECGDTFPTEKLLNDHLENEHINPNEETNEYQCSTCGKIFSTERACIIHQQIHARSTKRQPRNTSQPKKSYYTCKNIVCEVCGKRYASNAALRYHQRVHTGERPYQCTMCPKNFTMPLFLQIHVRTHTGERPYECPMCPKAFSNKAALLRHDRVHTGVKPYECPQCGKFFTQSNSMKLHVKTVHLKQPTPYKSKNRKAKIAMRQANIIASALANEVLTKSVPMRVTIEESDKSMEEGVDSMEGTEVLERVKIEAREEGEEEAVYQIYEDEQYNQSKVKVEISEIPVYEEDLDQSEIVYEEVYEMEEM